MNAAESLLRTAQDAGVRVCFANPGTTEFPFVAALSQVPGMRAVLALFEGVCTGAADGYGRMTGQPALALLHMGPGLANGLANLHNARRARSPVVTLVGDHATWHHAADAPLTADIPALAQTVSNWVRTNQSAAELSRDVAEAIMAAGSWPGQVSTLIVPHDYQMQPGETSAAPCRPPQPPGVADAVIERCAAVLKNKKGGPTALLLGGRALHDASLRAAARVAASSGCGLLCEMFPARLERGGGLPALQRIPYFPEQVLAVMSQYSSIVLAGAREPVAFFGYEGRPSVLVAEGQQVERLAAPEDDIPAALEALAERLGGSGTTQSIPPSTPPIALSPKGALVPETVAYAVASVQPEGAIVIDEGNTSSGAYFVASAGAPPHSYLTLTGGAIGQGLPCSVGAAVACPERPVIVLQADGSAMYTLQALWTQAREQLNVTTLILANRKYRILEIESRRAGVEKASEAMASLFSLGRPALDWVALAAGMGVPGVRVESTTALLDALRTALSKAGPHLIEVLL